MHLRPYGRPKPTRPTRKGATNGLTSAPPHRSTHRHTRSPNSRACPGCNAGARTRRLRDRGHTTDRPRKGCPRPPSSPGSHSPERHSPSQGRRRSTTNLLWRFAPTRPPPPCPAPPPRAGRGRNRPRRSRGNRMCGRGRPIPPHCSGPPCWTSVPSPRRTHTKRGHPTSRDIL